MRVGTKSLLFGVHQFIWHPITVLLAWRKLYSKNPTWRESICIVIHDWGYWGCPDMDGRQGEDHPFWAAKVAGRLFGETYARLCLFHSRHLAHWRGVEPSPLCWADKLSLAWEPWWWYLLRARLSGELYEYRRNAALSEAVPASATHREWFEETKRRHAKLAEERHGDAVPYVNPGHAHLPPTTRAYTDFIVTKDREQ